MCRLSHSCTQPRHAVSCCAMLQEGEPQGRHVVIVDDLVQSGGTLIECHALLSSLGATHGAEAGAGRLFVLLLLLQQQHTREQIVMNRHVVLRGRLAWA